MMLASPERAAIDQPQAFIIDIVEVWRELVNANALGALNDPPAIYPILHQFVKNLNTDPRTYLGRVTSLPDFDIIRLAAANPMAIDAIAQSANQRAEVIHAVHAAGFIFYMRCKELGLFQNAYISGELPYFLHHVTPTYAVLYHAPDSKLVTP